MLSVIAAEILQAVFCSTGCSEKINVVVPRVIDLGIMQKQSGMYLFE